MRGECGSRSNLVTMFPCFPGTMLISTSDLPATEERAADRRTARAPPPPTGHADGTTRPTPPPNGTEPPTPTPPGPNGACSADSTGGARGARGARSVNAGSPHWWEGWGEAPGAQVHGHERRRPQATLPIALRGGAFMQKGWLRLPDEWSDLAQTVRKNQPTNQVPAPHGPPGPLGGIQGGPDLGEEGRDVPPPSHSCWVGPVARRNLAGPSPARSRRT